MHYGAFHLVYALFLAMAPFSAVGALLMIYIWLTTRGRDVKGS